MRRWNLVTSWIIWWLIALAAFQILGYLFHYTWSHSLLLGLVALVINTARDLFQQFRQKRRRHGQLPASDQPGERS